MLVSLSLVYCFFTIFVPIPSKQQTKHVMTLSVCKNVRIFELFWKNSLYVSGVCVCIFVALYVGMFVARTNKVDGIMS